MLSNYLAEIWGISIVVVCLALLIKETYIKRLFVSFEKEEDLFAWGLATFVIGLAIVLAHNVWVKNWQVVITIIGWVSLIKGLSILFFPELMKKWVKKMENAQFIPFLLVIGVLLGLAITYLGFTA